MIRRFRMTDLGYFLPNEWSDPDRLLDQIQDKHFVTMTMWNEKTGMVDAIMCFRNYAENNWHGAFLISRSFGPRQALDMKRYVFETMETMDAGRLQTESMDDEKLNAWHEFLGFEYEGTRRKMLYGRDFNMWAIVREKQNGR